jgi:hypothetical protein
LTIADEFREVLDEDVFGEIGKTVTLINKTTPIYNTRGEEEGYTASSSSITIVPWDLAYNKSNEMFGNFIEGSVAMVVRYDQAISTSDLITMEGITYKVQDINKNYLPDNVATILRLVKTEPVVADDIAST